MALPFLSAFFFLIFSGLTPASFAAETGASGDTVVLAPIVVEGASTDALMYDPIVPTQEEKLDSVGTSVGRAAEDQMPVPVTDYGIPGTTTQVRGVGRTVEDTNVQALGVPLNAVQGGGYDFSSFPQFMWTRYQFHLGPSTGAFDPGASSGTLSLTPWTSDVIGQGLTHARLTESVTRGLNQVSVGGAYGNTAALVGVSSINASGPSGEFSSILHKDSTWDVRAHFLGTSLTETSPGSLSAPTPDAQLQTARWIPILQANAQVSDGVYLKNSFFYDRSYLRFVNPDDHSSDSSERSNQAGAESVLLVGDWTFGASEHRAAYENVGFNAPDEWITHIQAGRAIHLGQTTLNAIASADGVSQVGFRPGGELGARWDQSDAFGVFAKANFSEKFPTFEDRYEVVPFFTPNPELGPEQALSFNIGAEAHGKEVSSTLQAYLQYRYNAQIFTGTTVANEGNARELSLLHDLKWSATPWLDVIHGLRLSNSFVSGTQSRIPYDPVFTEVLTGKLHEKLGEGNASFGATFRTVSDSTTGFGNNSGYGYIDLVAGYDLGLIRIEGRVDDLTDRPIQVVTNYPWLGRIFALSVIGSI